MSQEWRLRAACRGTDDPRAFGKSTEQEAFIKDYCRHCPVKRPCFEFSVEADSDGVYGGTTRRQRAAHGAVPKACARRATERRWRKPPECGTRGGYVRHRKGGEEACGPCKTAAAEYQRKILARRRPA